MRNQRQLPVCNMLDAGGGSTRTGCRATRTRFGRASRARSTDRQAGRVEAGLDNNEKGTDRDASSLHRVPRQVGIFVRAPTVLTAQGAGLFESSRWGRTVRWRFTKVVLPTPPSPTRRSLNCGAQSIACQTGESRQGRDSELASISWPESRFPARVHVQGGGSAAVQTILL